MKVRDPPPSSSVIFSSKKWLGTGAPCRVRCVTRLKTQAQKYEGDEIMKRSLRGYIFAAFVVLPLTMVAPKISNKSRSTIVKDIDVFVGVIHANRTHPGTQLLGHGCGSYLNPTLKKSF